MAQKKYPDKMLKQLAESSKPKTSSIPNYGITETDEKLKYTLMKLDNKNVVMSNVIVLGSQPTSLIEAKLLRILLSQTKSLEFQDLNDIMKNPPVFFIEVKELAKMFYTNDTSNIYRDIQSAAVSLTTRNIFFKKKESDEWISYPWTSFVKYGNGLLEVKINPDLYPYLIHMKGNFSKFSLDVLLSFKSKYSMRLYEGLQAKTYRDTATRETFKSGRPVDVSFDIDELRVITSTVLIYSKLYNLKKRCIEPAIAEISEKTTMEVQKYTVDKRGGGDKTTIVFRIRNKEPDLDMDVETEAYAPLKVYRLDDNANLDSGYIEEVFNRYEVPVDEGSGEVNELLALYGDKTSDFNFDFQKMVEKESASGSSVKKMIDRKKKNKTSKRRVKASVDHNGYEETAQKDAGTSSKPKHSKRKAVSTVNAKKEAVFADYVEIPVNPATDAINRHLNNNETLDLSYVTRLLNAAEWHYTIEDIGMILMLYGTDVRRFNGDFIKAAERADHNPVGYLIKIAENTREQAEKRPVMKAEKQRSGIRKTVSHAEEEWLDAGFEVQYQEILDYWGFIVQKMSDEYPEFEGEVRRILKPIRRTDIRQKRHVHQLFEEGETVDSIKDAIDIAAESAYFIRTQGSFNFFINPKNFYDIAAGERDYDAEAAELWKMSRE